MTDNIPKGVFVILIADDGHVWGNGSCFTGGGPSGFSQADNQARTAKQLCIRDFIKRSCIPAIAECMSSWDAGSLVEDLIEKKKWRFETIKVGYDE